MTDTSSSSSRISREELHQAVWSEPMRTVAKRFGVVARAVLRAALEELSSFGRKI